MMHGVWVLIHWLHGFLTGGEQTAWPRQTIWTFAGLLGPVLQLAPVPQLGKAPQRGIVAIPGWMRVGPVSKRLGAPPGRLTAGMPVACYQSGVVSGGLVPPGILLSVACRLPFYR
jgi:hypothetical protein